MNDENSTPSEESPDEVAAEIADETAEAGAAFEAGEGVEADSRADAAWSDVIEQLDSFAQAAGRWARAAVDDPANRARATELKEHVEKTAREIGDSIDGAVDSAGQSDVGASFKDAASKTGEAFATAGKRVTEETAPRMASAFRGAAEALRSAAEKMEASAPTSPPPPPSDDASDEVEPDAPSDSAEE